MSYYYMKHGKPEEKKYTRHGRTKQSYKDSCDINKLLEKGAKAGSLSHLERHGARYGDFADIDWENVPLQLAEGRQVFNELPAEIKKEFDQNPGKFYDFVTDPENSDRVAKLLPQIAERGKFFPNVNKIETRTPETAPEATTGETVETPRVPTEEPAEPDST